MADRVGQQLGNYRLIHLLGRGGSAEVYLGEHVYLNTQAAIKIFRDRLVGNNIEQFRYEARAVASLDHPDIARLLDFGVDDGIPFLVMEYAANGTLRQRHPGGIALPLTTIVAYVKQIASALQYAHNRKLIHRNIKPENMLLGRHNEILLSDFGITALISSTPDQSIARQGTLEQAGIATYLAPEQIQGKPSPSSDQYALAVVVYEWLSGVAPFKGGYTEIAMQHMSAPPLPLRERVPTISPDLEWVVLTALAKDPKRRFASVQAFANALEQASLPVRPSTVVPGPSSPTVGASTLIDNPRLMPTLPTPASTPQPGYERTPTTPGIPSGSSGTPPVSTPWSGYGGTPTTPSVPLGSSGMPQSGYGGLPPASTPSILSDIYGKSASLLERVFSGLGRMTGKRIKESQLSLFAIARANLEVSDRAYVGHIYHVQAGISGSKPATFRAEPIDVIVPDPDAPLAFDILVHVSDNVQLVGAWHQRLTYYPSDPSPQLVKFIFQVEAPGHGSIAIDFYHNRRWLRTVRLEFEAVEQSQHSTVSSSV